MSKPNAIGKPLTWLIAGAKAAFVLAALSGLGCHGSETTAENSDQPASATVDETVKPVILTRTEQTELEKTIDESKQLLEGNNPVQSLAPLKRSVELDPNSFAAHNNLCVAYGMMGERDKAVAACERALEITPEDQLAKNNLRWVSSLSAAPTPAAPSAK